MSKSRKLLNRNSKKKYKGGSFLLPGATWKSKSKSKSRKSPSKNNANKLRYDLKHMSRSKIYKIYRDIEKEKLDFSFDCKIMATIHDRDMVNITSINGKKLTKNLVFFKSTGSSRMTFAGTNSNTKNIWFPCDDICLSPLSQRITKAENRFLTESSNNFARQMNLENNTYIPKNNQPFLSKYGRFINKQNAMISKMLGEGFKCKAN